MPKWVVPSLALLAVLALAVFALVARDRLMKSPVPRFDIIPDMDRQLKYKTQSKNPMFADGRAMRYPVAGTVARGEWNTGDSFHTGLDAATWTTAFPIPIDDKTMRRGQQRYNIYCATCHGLAGYGDGITAKRADKLQEGTWTPPANFNTGRLRDMPVGEIFNSMTYGLRTMPAYGPQIPEADRWAIIAYLRALQRSQNATLEDVPPGERPQLK